MPRTASLDEGYVEVGREGLVGGLEFFLRHSAELHSLSFRVSALARVSQDCVSDQGPFDIVVAVVSQETIGDVSLGWINCQITNIVAIYWDYCFDTIPLEQTIIESFLRRTCPIIKGDDSPRAQSCL